MPLLEVQEMQLALELGTAVLGIALALPLGWAALDGVLTLAFGRPTPIAHSAETAYAASAVPAQRGEG
jgi:hypothetical protein